MKLRAAVLPLVILALLLISGCKQQASKQLADGIYLCEVTMEGGSGRATIETPTRITVKDGQITARIVWSSSNYDYMIVDGTTYQPVNTEGNSVFEIPVADLSQPLAVQADTVAMSTPHLIDYTFTFDASSVTEDASLGDPIGEMELQYAEQFSVLFYENGYSEIRMLSGDSYLLVPEDQPVPQQTDAVILQQPLQKLYLSAPPVVDLVRELGRLDRVRAVATAETDWAIPEVQEHMASGDIIYTGKYDAPDFERLVEEQCQLAICSTMILHTPETKEQLERLGIPVLVDYSSYEAHPLGRVEWIRLYGLLLGETEAADSYCEQVFSEVASLEAVSDTSGENTTEVVSDTKEDTRPKVLFFYINGAGNINVRKPGDHISKMIEMAGGTYGLNDLLPEEDNALSTMTIEQEVFYEKGVTADVLIYNSTIAGSLEDLDQLLELCPMLGDFKAVKEGRVWCTERNLYQEITGVEGLIRDMQQVCQGTDEDSLQYLYRLK